MIKTKKSIVKKACGGKGGEYKNPGSATISGGIKEVGQGIKNVGWDAVDRITRGKQPEMTNQIPMRYQPSFVKEDYLGRAKSKIANAAKEAVINPIGSAAVGIGAAVKGLTGSTPKDIVKGAVKKVKDYRKASYEKDLASDQALGEKYKQAAMNPDNFGPLKHR